MKCLPNGVEVYSLKGLYALLRFGRKNEGPWTDTMDGDMPDDSNTELLAYAPALLFMLEAICAHEWTFVNDEQGRKIIYKARDLIEEVKKPR